MSEIVSESSRKTSLAPEWPSKVRVELQQGQEFGSETGKQSRVGPILKRDHEQANRRSTQRHQVRGHISDFGRVGP
jgi:hypothetical protein